MLQSIRIVWIEKWHTIAIVPPSYGYLKLLKATRVGKKSNNGFEVKSMGIELGTSRTEVQLTGSARELTNFANSCSSVLLFSFITRQNILIYLN